ncbi:MAG: UTP--glucose-1-phosphate uridylyltransferase [Verrucomicrobia bacterium]|nr:UTP--glucose-1-phosphate uridylyltransferase [Verrucomicrobiota bacterium]MCH8528663.1 UTP--glucose-1-phosphate uridylyltransferase [Kiritimatiellia bacterium]
MKSIEKFLGSFDGETAVLVKSLLAADQAHLFEHWDHPDATDRERKAFLDQLREVNRGYPGGLVKYIENARRLLAEAKAGVNPFEGFVPEQPDVVDLSDFRDRYHRMEALGMEAFDRTAVVLVAGGLGERLGYDGIKLGIPVEVLEETSYLEHYARCLLAMEARMSRPKPVPFVIMTSKDTHDRTVKALKENDWYGLAPGQVHLLKQGLVPAIADNDAHLAMEGPFSLQLKPHGHGDVHMLLHTHGVAAKLQEEGIEYLTFIQDTNGQVFNVLPAAVGVSIDQNYDFNSVAVNRVPGEAVGGLARLVKGDRQMTLNVEYNQLDPLLKSTISPEGDVAGENGYSLFPGNINVLVVRNEPYVRILKETEGIIAEFVNPKYADAARNHFKKPTRLETLMQDLPKLFTGGQRVGVSVFARSWCFSPNKNRLEDAAEKHEAGGPPESAATAESDFYAAGRLRLEKAGTELRVAKEALIRGVPYTDGPRVVLRPDFAMTLAEVDEKITGGSLAGSATLIVEGRGVRLDEVHLADGAALVIHAHPGAEVTVRGVLKAAGGFVREDLTDVDYADPSVPAVLKMRGYRYRKQGVAELCFNQPGVYEVDLEEIDG